MYIYVCMHNESSNATITFVFNHADMNGHVGFACRFARCLLTCGDAPLWPCGLRLLICSSACWPVAMRLFHFQAWSATVRKAWRQLALGLGPDLRRGLENPYVNRKRLQGNEQRESKEDTCEHEWSLCRSQQTHCWHVSYYCIVYVYTHVYIYTHVYTHY